MKLILAGWLCGLALIEAGAAGHAASFDCEKARSPVKMATCQDPILSSSDTELGLAFDLVQRLSSAEEKTELVREERTWLDERVSQCKLEAPAQATDDDVVDCLRKATGQRLKALRERAIALGADKRKTNNPHAPRKKQDTVVLTEDASLKLLFRRLATKGLPFSQENEPGNDGSRMDFVGNGRPQIVFAINEENSHFQYDWYIVATDDEVDTIRQIIADDLEAPYRDRGERDDDLFTRLRHPRHAEDQPMSHETTPHGPSLSSQLFDASNTRAFEGWYTSSHLFKTDDGRILIVASSVNNLGGPAEALLQPLESGEMRLLCYHLRIGRDF
jgi:uncharacterized protein